ncbi:hypothetical protein P4V58_21915 [Bacillus wiedmannii]|uniref:hypothetical protein n=1 Tax=Bacillus wiedmannii TaxID=1890302 RepID=UPI002E1DA77F|nr:hypothetical protein [Bacillus wiedmannii]
MAKAWNKTSCDNLSYGKVLNHIIEADRELNEGKYKQTIIDCFDWRGISPEEDDSPIRLKTHIVDELIRMEMTIDYDVIELLPLSFRLGVKVGDS